MKDMAKHYDLEWNEHIKIKKYCDKIGIDYLSSCCDISAIDFHISFRLNISKLAQEKLQT